MNSNKSLTYKIWCCYHDKEILIKYDLTSNICDNFVLYYSKNDELNDYLNEFTMLSHIAHNEDLNNIDYIATCHYEYDRRILPIYKFKVFNSYYISDNIL